MSRNDLGGRSNHQSDSYRDASAREEQLGRILADYADRVNAGEHVQTDEILEAYPELAGELAVALEGLEALRASTDDDNSPLGTLGDYTLRRQIGRGGMGTVYDAWQNSMDRRVALKVLPRALAADTRTATRFIREAQIAGKLDHPNVVHVHGTGVEEQVPYYAMEFVDGESLAQILARIKDAEPETETAFGKKNRPAYFEKLAESFADVADGLQHAHSKGVTHRDIKPSNLILDSDDRLRILDFGLARLEGQESLTLSGDFVGTPLYMSPEQARRKKIPVDHRTDVYSLGATMYETICGRPPFRGKDHADTLSRIIERDPVEPRKVNTRVPKDLETIVLKCLRKDSGDRYGTAEALAQDLRRFVRGDAIEARAQSRWELTTRRIYQWKLQIGLGLVCVLLVLAGILLLAQQRTQQAALLNGQYGELVHRALAQLAVGSSLRGAGGRSFVGSDLWWLMAVSGVSPYDRAHGLLEEAERLLPYRPEATFYRARIFLAEGQDDKATAALSKCVASAPDFPPARILLLDLEQGAGQEAKAAETSDASWRLWLHAAALERKGDWGEAVVAYERLLRTERDLDERLYTGAELDVYLSYSRALVDSDDFSGAFAALGYTLWRWPELVEPRLLLGKAWYLHGSAPDAEEYFETAHRVSPLPDEVSVWVAWMYFKVGALEASQRWAERIEDEGVRRYVRLRVAIFENQWTETIPALQALASTQPTAPRLQDLLSRVCLRAWSDTQDEEYLRDAIRASKKLIELQPENPEGWSQLGWQLGQMGEYTEAVNHIKRAIALAPTHEESWRILASTLSKMGKQGSAKNAVDTALKLSPRSGIAFNLRGLIFNRSGWLRKARQDFLRSHRIMTSWPTASLNIAAIDLTLGDLQSALEFAREAQRRSPNALKAHLLVASILWRMENRQKAIACLEQALGIPEGGREHTHKELGRMYLLEGRLESATPHLARALARLPRDADTRRLFVETLARMVDRSRCEDVAQALDALESIEGDNTAEDSGAVAASLACRSLALLHRVPVGSPRDEEALETAQRAVGEGERSAWEPYAALAAARYFTGDPSAAIRELEKAAMLMPSSPALREQLAVYRAKALPALLTCASVDVVTNLSNLDARHVTDAVVRRYLEARRLERVGAVADSLSRYRDLVGEPHATVPALYRLLVLGDPDGGRLASAALASPNTWREFLHRVRNPDDVVPPSYWETAIEWLAASRPSVATPAGKPSRDEAVFDELVEALRDLHGESLRINCGGSETRTSDGLLWRSDRFYLRGDMRREYDPPELDDRLEPPFRTRRFFPLDEVPHGYRIPVSPGKYSITLHFAERRIKEPGVRRFGIRVEDIDIDVFSPGETGLEVPTTRTATVAVSDGLLTIAFRHVSEFPFLSALEVRRSDS